MSQTALETKPVESTVDERMARIDRAMPAPYKAPTLYKVIPIETAMAWACRQNCPHHVDFKSELSYKHN